MRFTSNMLEKISFELPPAWKIPFYNFIGGNLKLTELEKEIHRSSELESIIGEDVYIELVSFDFANSHIYNDVVELILNKLLIEENEYQCKLYVLIGEFYKQDIRLKTKKSKSLPEAVVAIFEGAHIHVNWKGVNNPACDIEFLQKVSRPIKSTKGCKRVLPSSAVSIGYAHNDHIELLMDDNGIVYIYLNVIDELYYGGEFLKSLMILFFGLEYGEPLCR